MVEPPPSVICWMLDILHAERGQNNPGSPADEPGISLTLKCLLAPSAQVRVPFLPLFDLHFAQAVQDAAGVGVGLGRQAALTQLA